MSDPDLIINTYDQLMTARRSSLPDVAIRPHHFQSGRSGYRDGWSVYRPGYNFNGDASWRDGTGKIFSEFRRNRKEAFAAAVEWAGKKYKVSKFVRNRAGDYVDDRVNELFPLPKRERKKKKEST